MASKQIFDHPELLSEDAPLFDLTEATKRFPTKCCRSTIERFVRRGSRGVTLATVMVGGRRYTTENAIHAFLVGQQHTEPDHAQFESKQGNLSKKKVEEASRKFGLPEPPKSGNDGACQSLLEMVVNIDCPNAKKSTQPLTKEK